MNIFAVLIRTFMNKVFYIIILFLVFSCGKTQQTEVVQEDALSTSNITKEDIASISYTEYVIDHKVALLTENWPKYNELQDVIEKLKLGDVSYFRNNKEIVLALLKDLNETIPETLNSPAVLARLVAMENAILKLESLANLTNIKKEDMVEVIGEVLIAHNNLNLQMNKKIERESQKIYKP